MYQARILDKDRTLKAILPGVRWHYNRRINEATEVSVYIPRETIDEVVAPDHPLYGFFGAAQPVVVEGAPKRERGNKPAYAAIASYVQIYQGDKLKASGKIVGRTLGQVVTVEGYTEEILLEANLTPAQYGKVWDGWDLADLARDVLDGWQSIRVKDASQWQSYMVASSNIDLTTDPGKVMLAKRASGQYYDSGYITLLFNKNEVIDFKGWDRVRWSADSDGLENPDKIVWTTIQTSTDGSSWSAEFDGGLPEEVGLAFTGTSDDCWVRINLYTNDTISPVIEEGPPVGQTPRVFAVELIARTHGDLVVGNVPSSAGVRVAGLSADHATALKVLYEACEQVGWEFNVWDGALNLAESIGSDRTKDFVFRNGSNVEIATLSDGDEGLVNILTAHGPGRGINRLEITLREEDSIQEYGPYPNRETVEFNVATLAELTQKAQEYLDEHSLPKMDFAITALFKYGQEPEYGVGDKVRVADPDTGIITETRIVAEAREYGAGGLTVNLELGKPSFTLTEAIGRDGKDGKDGKDGRDGKDGKDGKDGEDFVPPIPADPVWGGYSLTNALNLTWRKAEHASDYEIRNDLNWGNATGMIFRGYTHSLSFVPRDRELILYLRALNIAGEYSEGYDTLNVSLPAPDPPDQPAVEPYFSALKVHPTPLNDPAVMGYFVYVEGDGISDKVAVIAGGEINYPAPSGTTLTIQVSAYDILGEGGKSEPLQATTTALDEMDIPDWVKEPLENIEEKWVIDTDAEGNISGLVKVNDPDFDGSHVAVLVDRFSIATPAGRKQVFAFDSQDQVFYVIGDIIAEGLIRATEVQAEVIKALLLQAELGVFDEIHGLRIKADKITVGGDAPGLVSTKPANSHLWHFDNSLQSTQGLSPVSGSATLVPDGGKFGGGVVVQSPLGYDTGVGNKHTVAVYRDAAKVSDYADMNLQAVANM